MQSVKNSGSNKMLQESIGEIVKISNLQTKDVSIIAWVLVVQHIVIVMYGRLLAWLDELGLYDDNVIFETHHIQEIKAADILSEIAAGGLFITEVNAQAVN